MSSECLRRDRRTGAEPGQQPSQVFRILDGYLAQLESGQQPDAELLIAQHPELADELRVYLDKLELLHQGLHVLRQQLRDLLGKLASARGCANCVDCSRTRGSKRRRHA